jgi:hypothetical protein
MADFYHGLALCASIFTGISHEERAVRLNKAKDNLKRLHTLLEPAEINIGK